MILSASLVSILVQVVAAVASLSPLPAPVSGPSATILSLNAMVVVPVTILLTNTASGSPLSGRCSLHRHQRPSNREISWIVSAVVPCATGWPVKRRSAVISCFPECCHYRRNLLHLRCTNNQRHSRYHVSRRF